MYWSAALQLRSGAGSGASNASTPLKRQSYGSFSRTSSSSSLHIPPSIPEHQCVSQFASPRFRLAPLAPPSPVQDQPLTLTSKLLQLNEQQFSRQPPPTAAAALAASRRAGEKARLLPARAAADDASVTYSGSSGGEEPNPQEHELEAEEHNYWMLERERRRLGLHKSRRRTCTPLSERATTSTLKVGVIMCSVPLVLVLVFIVVVLALGRGGGSAGASLMDFVWGADRDAHAPAAAMWTAVVRQWNDSIANLDAFPRASWALRGAAAGAGAGL